MFNIKVFGDTGLAKAIPHKAGISAHTVDLPPTSRFTITAERAGGSAPEIRRVIYTHPNGEQVRERQSPYAMFGDKKSTGTGLSVRSTTGELRELHTKPLSIGTHRIDIEATFKDDSVVKKSVLVNVGVQSNTVENRNEENTQTGERIVGRDNELNGPVESSDEPKREEPPFGEEPFGSEAEGPTIVEAADTEAPPEAPAESGGDIPETNGASGNAPEPDNGEVGGSPDSDNGTAELDGNEADGASPESTEPPVVDDNSGDDNSGDNSVSGTGYYIDPFCGQIPVRLSGYGDRPLIDHAEVGAFLHEVDLLYKSYLRGG